MLIYRLDSSNELPRALEIFPVWLSSLAPCMEQWPNDVNSHAAKLYSQYDDDVSVWMPLQHGVEQNKY
jgi:hypothetical protein